MTISNYLTLFRILMVPVFVAVLLDPGYADYNGRLVAVVILAVASLTDALDGYLARVRNEVTRLGALLDPIADKILISAGMISLVRLGLAPAWIIVIILSREFAVSGLRLIAASEGFQVKVSHYGKFKMVAQVLAIGLLIYSPETHGTGIVMLYVVMFLSLISMALYFQKFWAGIQPERKKQLSHRRSLKEIKENVISTTKALRKLRLKKKELRLQNKILRASKRRNRRYFESLRSRIKSRRTNKNGQRYSGTT